MTTQTEAPEVAGATRQRRPLLLDLVVGVSAGALGGLVLLALQALARLLLGVGPVAELAGDRIAPLVGIDRFFALLGFFGGYDELKAFGIIGGALAQIGLHAAIGVAAVVGVRRAVRAGREPRATLRVAVLLGGLALLVVALLWPVLGTSWVGLPPTAARVVWLLAFGALVVVDGLVLRWALGSFGRPHRSGAPAAGRHDSDAPEEAVTSPDDTAPDRGRRGLLATGVGIGAVVVTGAGGAALVRRSTFPYDGQRLGGPGITPITRNRDFYVVTKNVVDPIVTPGLWRLQVTGRVERPLDLSLGDVLERPAVQQETTLMCISNGVGSGLESNARWVGVPLGELLAEAGADLGAPEVRLTAVDGYSDTFALDKAMAPTTLLAYGMNGEPLPRVHGYPLRVIVPGLFGEKNVKWLTRVEVLATEGEGFYEQQGWGPNFVVPTRSRFSEPDFGERLPAGRPVTLRGTAFAGDRGIRRVEVSTDGERTWADAAITYAGPDEAWSLWAFDWTPDRPGDHELAVRATDRAGEVQTADRRGIAPEGATGYHRVTARVQ